MISCYKTKAKKGLYTLTLFSSMTALIKVPSSVINVSYLYIDSLTITNSFCLKVFSIPSISILLCSIATFSHINFFSPAVGLLRSHFLASLRLLGCLWSHTDHQRNDKIVACVWYRPKSNFRHTIVSEFSGLANLKC